MCIQVWLFTEYRLQVLLNLHLAFCLVVDPEKKSFFIKTTAEKTLSAKLLYGLVAYRCMWLSLYRHNFRTEIFSRDEEA